MITIKPGAKVYMRQNGEWVFIGTVPESQQNVHPEQGVLFLDPSVPVTLERYPIVDATIPYLDHN